MEYKSVKSCECRKGVTCPRKIAGVECNKCGMNPPVSHKRLVAMVGDERAKELEKLSFQNSAYNRKYEMHQMYVKRFPMWFK